MFRKIPAGVSTLVVGLLWGQSAQAQPVYEGVDDLPTIELRLGETMGPTAVTAAAPQAFVDYITKASNGKIKVEVFWSNSLYTPTESSQNLGAGVADIGNTFAHFRPSDFPVANWIQLIGVEVDGGNPYATMVAQGAAAEFFGTSPEVIAEFAGHNIKLLGGIGANAYDIMCTSKVSNLAEAAGKRSRTGTTTLAKEAAAVGMVATPIDSAEAYEAFSRGIIDCGTMEPSGYMSSGMVEVPKPKFWTPVEHTGLLLPGYGMNLDKWNSLPPVAQRIIQDAIGVHAQKTVEQRIAEMKRFGDLIKKGDITAVQPEPELQERIDAVEKELLDGMVAQAPPAIKDPEAVKTKFLGLLDKWDKIVRELGVEPSPKDATAIVESWYTEFPFDAYGQRFAKEVAAALASK